ncbi:MAG: peptidase C25 [Flavobacterium sp.]|nr:MAG: peptidase C25 [Flavobacterium sp.]
MKKTLLFFSIILMSLSLGAQNRFIEINWDNDISLKEKAGISKSKNTTVVKSKTSNGMLLFESEISYTEQWRDTYFADKNSLQISNIKYGTLLPTELNSLNKELIPNKLTFNIASGKAREIIYTSLQISPIIKTNTGYKKVLSFTVNYTYSNKTRSSSRIQITNSVLASGKWYRFKVDKTGVYKVTKSFLSDLGMNTNNIDPRKLKIYGNGGKPLPFLNEENTIFDLEENSIQVIGEADGSFDSNDHILFYGTGTLGYLGTETETNFDTNINPYSDEAYYYVTVDGNPGLRIQNMVEPTGNASTIISQFNDYQFFEEDTESPVKVGRRWYGNRFDIESEQSFVFDFPNIVSGQPMNVKIKVASASEALTSMALSVNGTSLNPINFSPIDDPFLLDAKDFEGEIPSGNSTVTIDLLYNNAGNPSSIGYLDYISVEALRELAGVSGQFSFRYNNAAILPGIGEYQLSNAAQFTQIWDVTNAGTIVSKQKDGNASAIVFKATLGELREYVAISPNDYYTPTIGAQSFVPNQNLKGAIFNDESGNFKDIDYLIVTPSFLLQPALRLANHRKEIDGLNIKVVTLDKIYHEFSSGKQDIGAIRNFVRYIYENASSENNRIKYLCLFGDTSIDYKNRLANNNNIVPIFHRLDSRSTFRSFMSDDYFGNMDPNEGLMLSNEKLDIAVGRMLADNVSLANAMIDKIVNYESKESFGNWRNNFVLISDDVDKDWEFLTLQGNLDILGDQVALEKPNVNVKKIHSDSYQQVAASGGDRYPDVNDGIEDAIEVGALIVNYFGHGGEDGLASELIFTKDTGINLENVNRYPCIVTVTCEFTKFDNPLRTTAGELTFWNKKGGAISMVTTTRSIGAGLGVTFNQVLAPELFGYGLNVPHTPAEALRVSKNEVSDGSGNRRVIFYIGDPAMHLAFPREKIKLTSLNNIPIFQSTDVLQALGRVKIGGEVQDENGNLLSNYNGILEAKLFDKNVQRQTLGNDGVFINGELAIMDFTTLGETLFNGKVSVVNGLFEFEFVMPRDTQIPIGNGRISFYSQENNTLIDHAGFDLRLKIGGLNENAPEDNIGPLINLFMNDENFVSGGVTNSSPILIAKISDENGMNTASGIGHDMVAILDGNESDPYVLNEFYQAEVDDYTKGALNFKLRNLEEGLHTLTFKAWDVYNNSSTAEIQFIVAGSDKLEITHVLNYPNPFVNYTEFWFNHNRPFEPLEVQIQIFTVTGKVVWTRNQVVNTDGFLSRGDIIWDGKDDFGDRIGKGVYVYKITVKSTLTNQRVEKFEKLVIL